MKLGVVLVLVLVAGCGGSSTQQGVLPGRAPAEVPGLDGGLDSSADHIAIAAAADATGAPAAEVGAPAQDAAPAGPDAEVFPSCAEIGIVVPSMNECDGVPPYPQAWVRRTPDQRFSCSRCTGPNGEMQSRSCVGPTSTSAKPPWLCVASCAACPFFDCSIGGVGTTSGAPCTRVGLDAGAGG